MFNIPKTLYQWKSIMINPGFKRKKENTQHSLPPGQYVEEGFPILTAGPTPYIKLDEWAFEIKQDNSSLARWTWKELTKLPISDWTTDIHCVTKWSKFDTNWTGVRLDALLQASKMTFSGNYVMVFCDGGYTTNIPLEELLEGKSLIAFEYEGAPISIDHGGPVRLIVPGLYFWKSAKWIRGIKFMDDDRPGFWEEYGYHMLGDPWREQRYWGD